MARIIRPPPGSKFRENRDLFFRECRDNLRLIVSNEFCFAATWRVEQSACSPPARSEPENRMHRLTWQTTLRNVTAMSTASLFKIRGKVSGPAAVVLGAVPIVAILGIWWLL